MAKYEDLEKEYPDTFILQLRGMFYNAFGDGARVLSYLMDYKLKLHDSGLLKAGFPSDSLNKVCGVLKQNHINYVVLDNSKVVSKCFFDDNQYASCLKSCPDVASVAASDEKVKNISNGKDTAAKKVADTEASGKPVKYKFMDEIMFLEHLCNGKDPLTGNDLDKLDLNDGRVVRMLFKVRDALSYAMDRKGCD